ncbi:MAG: hypothetical protein MZW92_80865 [Comamonadaceae bacterium]|nr:hypothetical protein [Comamonadaceae bacterium]
MKLASFVVAAASLLAASAQAQIADRPYWVTGYEDLGRALTYHQVRSRGLMQLEVVGQSNQGRNLYLARIGNPANPSLMIIAQQHGNEVINTEATLLADPVALQQSRGGAGAQSVPGAADAAREPGRHRELRPLQLRPRRSAQEHRAGPLHRRDPRRARLGHQPLPRRGLDQQPAVPHVSRRLPDQPGAGGGGRGQRDDALQPGLDGRLPWPGRVPHGRRPRHQGVHAVAHRDGRAAAGGGTVEEDGRGHEAVLRPVPARAADPVPRRPGGGHLAQRLRHLRRRQRAHRDQGRQRLRHRARLPDPLRGRHDAQSAAAYRRRLALRGRPRRGRHASPRRPLEPPALRRERVRAGRPSAAAGPPGSATLGRPLLQRSEGVNEPAT